MVKVSCFVQQFIILSDPQGEDDTLHQLEGEYRSLISQLSSRLGSGVAPAKASTDPTVHPENSDISSSAGAERAVPAHISPQSQGRIPTSKDHSAWEYGEQTKKISPEISTTHVPWDQAMVQNPQVSRLNPLSSVPHKNTPDASKPITSDPKQTPLLVSPTLYPFKNPAPRRQTGRLPR